MGCVQSHAAQRAESSAGGSSNSSGASRNDDGTRKLRARLYVATPSKADLIPVPVDFSRYAFADSFDGAKSTASSPSAAPLSASPNVVGVAKPRTAALCVACGHSHEGATLSAIRTASCDAADHYDSVQFAPSAADGFALHKSFPTARV